MNSIIGIKLNDIKVEKGVQHDKITGEIIMDNIKIGEFINDGWVEEYYVEFSEVELEMEFEKRMYRYYKRKKIKSISNDTFLKELLFISKEYKAVKDSKLNCEQLTFLWK